MLGHIIALTGFLMGSMGTPSSPNPSIIIIGSGASGIAAASKLLKNNFTNIKILEAENRIGGRIYSVTFGDAYVDLGAEYCDGEEDNIVYSLVKGLDILELPNGYFNFLTSDGKIVKNKIAENIGEFAEMLAANKIEDCEDVLSVGKCLPIKAKKLLSNVTREEKPILARSPDWAKTYLCYLHSAFDINDICIKTDYNRCEGSYFHWNGLGFKTILEVMMQKYPTTDNQLPIDDKVFLQKEVNHIDDWQQGQKIQISTTDGSTYETEHVIFTPSVGVLKANHQTLFSPSLPEEKISAIKNTGFGAIMKIIMHFPERWWKNDVSWRLVWTKKDKKQLKEKNLEWLITILGMDQFGNNPNVLIVLYAGSYIPFMETLTDEQLLEGQKYVINRFLAPRYNVTMPDKIIKTTWYLNPHFRGTYSYESVKGHATGGSKFPNKLAKPLVNQHNNPTVLFAGEATHPHYFGTVHGAIEAGYREAQRLIDLYKNPSSIVEN